MEISDIVIRMFSFRILIICEKSCIMMFAFSVFIFAAEPQR